MNLKSNRRHKNPLLLLKWVVQKFDPELAPFPALYDNRHHTWTWYCNGCNGKFTNSQSVEPERKSFPHQPDCKYAAIMKLVKK